MCDLIMHSMAHGLTCKGCVPPSDCDHSRFACRMRPEHKTICSRRRTTPPNCAAVRHKLCHPTHPPPPRNAAVADDAVELVFFRVGGRLNAAGCYDVPNCHMSRFQTSARNHRRQHEHINTRQHATHGSRTDKTRAHTAQTGNHKLVDCIRTDTRVVASQHAA